jgi:hypothetical protein
MLERSTTTLAGENVSTAFSIAQAVEHRRTEVGNNPITRLLARRRATQLRVQIGGTLGKMREFGIPLSEVEFPLEPRDSDLLARATAETIKDRDRFQKSFEVSPTWHAKDLALAALQKNLAPKP